MNKQQLRKKYILIRKEIDNKEIKSKRIQERVIKNSKYKNSDVVAIYVSLKNEVATNLIIINSLKANKIVAVPVISSNGNMDFYKINSLDDLVNINKLNVKEPISDLRKLINPIDINLFIVPGICFDKNKNRIGYGGGYYDRYLCKSPSSYKIGIAFNEQILDDIIQSEDIDVKLDEIITDKILIK